MLVACTACSHRFDAAGYRDVLCPLCSAIAQPRPCPRCTLPLVPRHIHELVIDECGQCRGMFLDAVAKRLLAEENADRAAALFAALAADPPTPTTRTELACMCPVCGVAMHRKLSRTGAGVVIDICKAHGTFFDGGELDRVLTFARREDAEQAKRADEESQYAQRHATPTIADGGEAILAGVAVAAAVGAASALGGPVGVLFAKLLLDSGSSE